MCGKGSGWNELYMEGMSGFECSNEFYDKGGEGSVGEFPREGGVNLQGCGIDEDTLFYRVQQTRIRKS